MLNFVFTFSVAGISRLGHIGGFVTGALCGLAIGGLAAGAPAHRRPVAAGRASAGLVVLVVLVVAIRTATVVGLLTARRQRGRIAVTKPGRRPPGRRRGAPAEHDEHLAGVDLERRAPQPVAAADVGAHVARRRPSPGRRG